MERREDALREALSKNSEETERWEKYKKDNENAIENLKEFSKYLSVEIMVPVGRKAFMPGKLIHTNEVLVGHYQGYFSNCSTHKAAEITELRLLTAKDQLKRLQAEAELWKNKLEKPYLEGVLPTTDAREIIEDYDEEQENRWRKEHKIKVKRAKFNEKMERQKETKQENKSMIMEEQKSDDDIFKILEEAELMEELENELGKLDVEEVNDEIIRKLMSGETELPTKKERTAHEPKVQNKFEINLNGVVKKAVAAVIQEKPPATNNNTHINTDIHVVDNDDASYEDGENDELPEEVRLIRNQAKFLPASDQVGFYEYQVEIIRNKVAKFRMKKESDIDEKLHLLTVQAELEDLLALAEEENENIESENESNIDFSEAQKNSRKRRISFALENETLVFRKSEAVSQMLPQYNTVKDVETSQRDVIILDDDVVDNSSDIIENDKKQTILEKVEKNQKYIAEHQNEKDSDLVTKIINEAMPTTARTIFITFKHSEQKGASSIDITSTAKTDKSTDENFIPGKPTDFYDLYLKQQQNLTKQLETIYVNGYIGEESVKVPILKEANRKIAFEDPRTKFSDPNKTTENNENSIPVKSILRNKSAFERETHPMNPTSIKKPKQTKATFDEDEYMSAYYKVMNDVIEKPLTEPDPLPQENFIDAHTPKKRVSRFKQMRSEMGKP